MATALHLFIPGLLGAWPTDLAVARPTVPALEWLLTRADITAVPRSADALLFHLCHLPIPARLDLPVAALTALADGYEPGEGWWLRADPVHLRPDQRGIFLADARVLAIEPVEAASLAAAFDHTFASDGLQLQVVNPNRWYLRLADDPGLRTYPLADAIGRDINSLLPHGSNARRWHTLLTEAQMLFHSHPVNRAREERNQPLINGLWLWGGGPLVSSVRAPAASLYAHDPLARGLARQAGMAIYPPPDQASDWQAASRHDPDSLVILDLARYDRMDDDPAAWTEHIAVLERDWLEPCRRWVKNRQIQALHLYGGQGRRYSITGLARWRFWRRSRSVLM